MFSPGFLGAWSNPLEGITDPMIAELLALREGSMFARLRGYSHVIMEMDNLETVDLSSSCKNSRSTAMPIIREIWVIALSLSSFLIQHVSRTANESSHLCATRSQALDVTKSWINSSPDFLVSSLLVDCKSFATIVIKLPILDAKKML